MQPQKDTQPDPRKREAHLSKDGKWRSFPKMPNLLQYVSSGNYYGRIKVHGKLIRESLRTSVWTAAKLRLPDFLKKHQQATSHESFPSFPEAVEEFKTHLDHETGIKQRSKEYRLLCLQKILTTWPKVMDLRIDEITEQACKEWAAGLNGKIACHYFNNTIATLRQVIATGIKMHKAKTGLSVENPASELNRVRITQKNLQLPESDQFKSLLENIRKGSSGWGYRVADLVEFLAYSGLRIRSEAIWVTWEDIDWQKREIVVRGHPETGTKNSSLRRVPIIADMETLLQRLKDQLGTIAKGRIVPLTECNGSLARACKEIGIPKLTHHDLRHLFATRCIEAGVDIPTVSRWLGHKDGGALAMKTYGHLRNEHSRQMAARVKF